MQILDNKRFAPSVLFLGFLISIHCTIAVWADTNPKAFAVSYQAESHGLLCFKQSLDAAIACVRNKCANQRATRCPITAACEPAGWSAAIGVRLGDLHFTDFRCGFSSKQAAISGFNGICRGHFGDWNEIPANEKDCVLSSLWSPDGHVQNVTLSFHPTRSDSAPSVDDQKQAILEHVREEIKALRKTEDWRQPPAGEPDVIDVRIADMDDIDSDGLLDFIIWDQSYGACQQPGCPIFVFKSNGVLKYKKIFETMAFQSAFFASEKVNGNSSLAVPMWGTSEMTVYEILRWKGNGYEVVRYSACETDFKICAPVSLSLIDHKKATKFKIATNAKAFSAPTDYAKMEPTHLEPVTWELMGKTDDGNWYLVKTGNRGASAFIQANDVQQSRQ